MNKQIFESLDYGDLEGVLAPVVEVDAYEANMGKDKDIVTLSFVIRGEQAGRDLVSWFERGYDWVLDAKCSDGELSPGKYVVFVEMRRRSSVPDHIVELVTDLKTLTHVDLKDWSIVVDGDSYAADVDELKNVIALSPLQYRKDHEREDEINEMRNIAHISLTPLYEQDSELQSMINLARI